MINDYKPKTELNNVNNANNASNNDTKRGEWKIQLLMQNNCISVEDAHTLYSASKPVEIFMGSDTEDVNDKLFDTTLERFQEAIVTSQKNGREFKNKSVGLSYYYFMKIGIRRAESYVKCPDWIANKGTTINPKNETDNKCFQWSTTSGLNYNKIKKKYLKKIEAFKRVDIDLSSY